MAATVTLGALAAVALALSTALPAAVRVTLAVLAAAEGGRLLIKLVGSFHNIDAVRISADGQVLLRGRGGPQTGRLLPGCRIFRQAAWLRIAADDCVVVELLYARSSLPTEWRRLRRMAEWGRLTR